MRYPAGAAKKIARSLDTLKKQLTQSGKEVFKQYPSELVVCIAVELLVASE